MGCRKLKKARCTHCGVHLELCLCHVMPKIYTPFHWHFIQSARESMRPTSTGSLASKILMNSDLKIYGKFGEIFDEHYLLNQNETNDVVALLYPSNKAIELTQFVEQSSLKNFRLVVVDGTWREARRIINRLTPLKMMPHVKITEAPATAWGVRREVKANGLSTLEACTAIINLLHNSNDAKNMLLFLKEISRATFKMRGYQPPDLFENDSLSGTSTTSTPL